METLEVMLEIKRDPELQKRYIGFLRSEAMEEAEKRDALPFERMAAKSEDNMCVLLCERFILGQRFENYDKRTDVAEAHEEHAFVTGFSEDNRRNWIEGNQGYFLNEEEQRWLTDKGVALYNIGRVMEAHGLSVTRHFKYSVEQIREALGKSPGDSVIAVVNEETLLGKEGKDEPNHAVCVLAVGKDKVTLYNPSTGLGPEDYPMDAFTAAWNASRNFVVLANYKGAKPYDPHPEEIVENEEVSDSLLSLVESIAEHSHDVWARGRMDAGWRYGEKRDDDRKLHPDLVPYNDLPESEKDYDRRTAIMLIKMLQRLGYTITRNSENDDHCPECGAKITLDMCYCSKCGRHLQPLDFAKVIGE